MKNLAGKIALVATFAATIIVIINSGSVFKVQEEEAALQKSLSIFSDVSKIVPVMNEVTFEKEETQFVKSSVDTEELVIQDIEVKRNNLYYIVDDGYRLDVSEQLQNYLWDQCVEYEITDYYELLFVQIYHESAWNPKAVSGTNDYGLMQINKSNHEWLKDTLGITDFLDPYESIRAGVYIMQSYLKKYNDVQKALVCYNMGEGKVINGITSSQYSRDIVKDMDKLFILDKEEGK